MSKDQKLDEVRKLILSLLLARKGSTPVPVLERDYYDEEKKRIPYRQFGYTDLVGFLRSMPEHFIVEQYNGSHYVRGIASEKSKHVSSLVARQKVNQKTRPNPSSFHLRQPFNRRMQNMKPQQVKIAPDKLFLLMQHIKNNPSGVSLQNAVVFVQQMVPYINISMQELRAQLQELSHQLFLDGNMIYPVWSKDLHKVTRQQSLMEEPQSRDKLPSDSKSSPTTQTVFAAGQEDFDDMEYFSDENDFVSVNCANNYQRHAETSQFATNLAQYGNCDQTDMFSYNKDSNTEVNEDFATMNSNTEIKTAECFDLSQMINDRTKSRLEELIRKYPDGIWCAELPNIYFQEYKSRLNYNQLGFASVREFTSYLPNIFYMTQVNKTDDFKLYSADKRPVVQKTEPIDIVQTSNNRYEHSTTQAQCSNNNDDDDAPIPSEVSPTITQHFAPNDVINYNDNVEKISVTELKHNKKYLEVYIIEVFHPNFFWVHLRENKKRFNKMMDELSEFYECNRSTYTIAKVALKKEMHCACVYMSRWHRGIIKSVKPDFRVTIFFYDYGTLKTYAPEDVYYLHKKFSYLPAQAIPCGLYNVKPIVGDRWKKSVIDQFVDKIADQLLAATIISIDPTYNSMMVILTDTSEEEDVHINDWLVKERLAQMGKTADAVDMASIMKYVVNNLNQLPTYCFAEENLMPDNCYKATSTEEKYEVPLIASGPTLLHYDNHHQQSSVRPPPGFPPLSEQCVSSNLPTTSFYNDYSFTNTSNVKTSVGSDAEMTTNPFLADQGFIPSDIAKEMYMSIWNDNKSLQIKVIDILYDLLECSSLSFKNQVQLNKILKIIEKVLLEQKNDRSTVVKTSSTSNPVNETTLNDVGCAQKASYNLNNETFTKQDLNTNTFSISNPFSMNDDDRSQSNVTFSNYSDSFASKTNWNQSDEFNRHMQMPPSATTNPAPSVVNHVSLANTFLPNTQNDNNVPVTVSPAVPANTNLNNFSDYLDGVNTQFTNLLKDTNPFKFSMTNGMQESATNEIQVPEIQNERTSRNYDADIASYPSAKNSQSYASKTETVNTYMRSNCFTPVTENYTSKFIYESAPVMYNTQKKQTDTRQNTCNNLNNIQNTVSQSLEQDKKPMSQSDTLYTHKITNHIKREKLQVDENYVTRPSTCYTQGSQPIINGKPTYYQQNSNSNNLRPVSSQFWNQIETSEQLNSKFRNSVPLSNLGENTAFGTPTTLSQDWSCNSDKKSIPREINEVTDLNCIFKFKDCHDKKKPMDVTSWNNIENECIQRDATSNTNSFVFQKIDSVKGVTFIFNIEQDGWMLTYEFVETFTNLKLQSHLLAILEAMNIKVVFKEIQRSDYPLQFSQLDRYSLNVPRDSEKRITSINLISLQSALALLHKLKIVSREEIENAF